jgi:nucleotide-sensitive chloride channel 1A
VQRLPDPEDSILAIYGLLMNIELESQPSADDEEPDMIELIIVPPTRSLSLGAVQMLFDAVSTCSNLHPDPISQGDDEMDDDSDSRIMFEGNIGYEGISGLPGVAGGASDGGLPPPFPGSGGWITAENVGEYFDAEGNWLGDGDDDQDEEALGGGAGRVRGRDEAGTAATGVNGHREDGEEDHKRQRTE